MSHAARSSTPDAMYSSTRVVTLSLSLKLIAVPIGKRSVCVFGGQVEKRAVKRLNMQRYVRGSVIESRERVGESSNTFAISRLDLWDNDVDRETFSNRSV